MNDYKSLCIPVSLKMLPFFRCSHTKDRKGKGDEKSKAIRGRSFMVFMIYRCTFGVGFKGGK